MRMKDTESVRPAMELEEKALRTVPHAKEEEESSSEEIPQSQMIIKTGLSKEF